MNVDAVRKSIDEGNRNFGGAVGRRDYAGLAALYTENAKVLPPDGPVVTGRSIDLEVAGDTAHEVGEATLKVGAGEARAKYLVVWMKGGDGNWRLHRDIWNNMPAD
jgi:ketosteroid isomerase-like protein